MVAGLTEVVAAAVLDLKTNDLSALQTALTALAKEHEQAGIKAMTSQEELRVAISVAQVKQLVVANNTILIFPPSLTLIFEHPSNVIYHP